ncbi:MAG TPA: hypothetical protein VKD91_09835 [Pyrinomonadaceae bacterium]|nr:hypothetical protein [Pyrinomonadaceae bacterium]
MPEGGGFFTVGCGNASKWTARTTEWYPNAEIARHVFEERIQKAFRVHELNQKTGANREIIGDRVVADLRHQQSGALFTSIFWLADRHIYSVDSTSYYYALFYEWCDE